MVAPESIMALLKQIAHFLIQKCIIKQTNDYSTDYSQLQTNSKNVKTQLKSHNYIFPVISYISLELYLSLWSKTLLQRRNQIGICYSYHYLIGITSDWSANVLHVYKDRECKQVILLKLCEMVFAVFTKDSINTSFNEATKYFHCIRKLADDVIGESGLVG